MATYNCGIIDYQMFYSFDHVDINNKKQDTF